MPLTDAAARNAKPKEKPYKLADGHGLYLFVRPAGSKQWRLDYELNKKRKTLTLGTYPTVTLAQARKSRDTAKELIKSGNDPSFQKKIAKITRIGGTTFKAVAEEWLAKEEREGDAEITLHKKKWLLDFAYPLIGNRPIGCITPPELLAVLRTVEANGRYETARRLRSTCGRVFRYAIATGRAERDPSQDLQGALTAPTVTHRAALVQPRAIAGLLRAIDAYPGSPVTKYALQFSSLVFVRPGELRKAEWTEIDGEVWRIPAAKMKMRHAHLVPLSRQALAVIEELKPLTGHGLYLFPSFITPIRAMSENTVTGALRRMGFDKDEMTAHGFRGMASSRLNEMGWNPDAIERQLAHQEKNQIRSAYNHAQYLAERTRMMQAWADYLDALRASEGH